MTTFHGSERQRRGKSCRPRPALPDPPHQCPASRHAPESTGPSAATARTAGHEFARTKWRRPIKVGSRAGRGRTPLVLRKEGKGDGANDKKCEISNGRG